MSNEKELDNLATQEISISAGGGVLPADTLPKVALEADDFVLKVAHVEAAQGEGDLPVIHIEYPDGYKKSHQTADTPDLLNKITGLLRGRYGFTNFNFGNLPTEFLPGAEIHISKVKEA